MALLEFIDDILTILPSPAQDEEDLVEAEMRRLMDNPEMGGLIVKKSL